MLFGIGCTPDKVVDDVVKASISVTPNKSAFTYAGGATTFEVTSNGAWKVEADADVAINPTSGEGNGSVTISVPEYAADRNIFVKFTATRTGSIGGSPYPTSSSTDVVLFQNENGEAKITTNVKSIRTLLKAMPLEDAKSSSIDVTEEIAALSVVGVVVASPKGGNSQDFVLAVQDNNTESGAGLTLTMTNTEANKHSIGEVIRVSLKGAKVKLYNGLLQLSVNDSEGVGVFDNVENLTPAEVAYEDLALYESQYVKVKDLTPSASALYKVWSDSTSGVNVNFVTADDKTLVVRVNPSAPFKSEYVLPKKGDLCGVVGCYNTTMQLAPQTLSDIQLTVDAPELVKSVTIAEITEKGVYEVKDAWVVGYTGNGVILTDSSNAFVNVYIYDNTHKTIGERMSVAGEVSIRQGGFQFYNPYVTTIEGTAEVVYGEAKEYAGAELEALCEKFTAGNAAYLCEYVELKCVALKDGEYYGMVFPNVNTDKYEGSLSKTPASTLNLDALDGKAVILRGYVTDYSNPYLSVTATSVEEDTTAKYIVVTNSLKVVAAGVENETTNVVLAGVSAVTVTCDNSVVTTASLDGNTLTYSVAANEGAAREGWIKLSAEGVEATIAVSQERYFDPSSITSYSLTLEDIKKIEYSENWVNWALTAADGSEWSGFAYKNADYYQFSYSSNKEITENQAKSHLLSPIVPEGKKITKITIYPDNAKKTASGRKFVALPADFAYTNKLDSKGTEAVEAAYAVSPDTVKGSTDPLVIDLSSVEDAPRQVQIRAVVGAAYIIGVQIDFE